MFIISLKISQRVAATFSHLGSEWGNRDTIPQAVFKTGYNITSRACSGTTMSRREVGTELLPHPYQDLAKPGRVWAKGKQKCHAVSYSFECCVFLSTWLPLTTYYCSVQFSSVTQSCLTLCDPMNRSTPGLPVHHQLPESTQTHVHWVGDAIQPSHPLSSPSLPAFNLSQHQGLFQWVSSSHQVAKVLEFQLQHQSFQWTPRTDLLQDGLVGSPCTPRDSQESSPTPQFKTINSSVLSFLHSPTLTSIHDHWENHSLD